MQGSNESEMQGSINKLPNGHMISTSPPLSFWQLFQSLRKDFQGKFELE